MALRGFHFREEIIAIESGTGVETEVNEENEENKMNIQESTGELGGQNHAVLDEPVEIPAFSIDLK